MVRVKVRTRVKVRVKVRVRLKGRLKARFLILHTYTLLGWQKVKRPQLLR